jgi:hypothetical protein
MRGAGPRRGDADAEFARELGIGRRHESRHFLVRAWMNSILPLARLSAPNTPLMPSPG